MDMPRTASIRAFTPRVVASCDRETFDELVRPLFADDATLQATSSSLHAGDRRSAAMCGADRSTRSTRRVDARRGSGPARAAATRAARAADARLRVRDCRPVDTDRRRRRTPRFGGTRRARARAVSRTAELVEPGSSAGSGARPRRLRAVERPAPGSLRGASALARARATSHASSSTRRRRRMSLADSARSSAVRELTGRHDDPLVRACSCRVERQVAGGAGPSRRGASSGWASAALPDARRASARRTSRHARRCRAELAAVDRRRREASRRSRASRTPARASSAADDFNRLLRDSPR